MILLYIACVLPLPKKKNKRKIEYRVNCICSINEILNLLLNDQVKVFNLIKLIDNFCKFHIILYWFTQRSYESHEMKTGIANGIRINSEEELIHYSYTPTKFLVL